MDWEDLHHFSTFASHGTLTGAARALGVEHATVARRISALEACLDLKLVDRRGRHLVLTPDGQRIADIAETMGKGAAAISRTAAGARAELTGIITISAPPALAAARLVSPLAKLRQRHPQLEITLIGEARTAALEKREADIAIRLSRPEKGEFTITKVATMTFRFYASSAYLEKTPEHAWTFVGYDAPMAAAPQQARLRELAAGRPVGFTASTLEIQLAATKAGAGIAILPDFAVENCPELVCIHPDDPPFSRDVWLAIHSDMKAAPAVHVTIEALKSGFAEHDRH
ncbi:LysR family transcriptional regulator [Hyphomonas sp. ND6WE1B]|uniref:LysR family transcriptional regulator n=1 Tax=Hyphomonas sp. ND6WE1B TaxID=1848191 RepID=UPI0008075B85|nr:LysR family transcriptional regulator [Hyphomonas sp. ND6WE1B]